MGRKKLIRSKTNPYHVTIRCNNKEWFNIPMPLLWTFCINSLNKTKEKIPAKVQAFVLMNNHYHLLIWTPNGDIDKFMQSFNMSLSKKIRLYTGRINRIFGDRYHWSLIQDEQYYKTVLRYIYQNPLRANIVERCEDYPFSTLYLQTYNRRKKPKIDLHYPYFGNFNEFLFWVNQREQFSENELRKAIKKRIFKPSLAP